MMKRKANRDELAHLYLLSYYLQANPNRGWRRITVSLVGDQMKKYQIRTRTGYCPTQSRISGPLQDSLPEPNGGSGR